MFENNQPTIWLSRSKPNRECSFVEATSKKKEVGKKKEETNKNRRDKINEDFVAGFTRLTPIDLDDSFSKKKVYIEEWNDDKKNSRLGGMRIQLQNGKERAENGRFVFASIDWNLIKFAQIFFE